MQPTWSLVSPVLCASLLCCTTTDAGPIRESSADPNTPGVADADASAGGDPTDSLAPAPLSSSPFETADASVEVDLPVVGAGGRTAVPPPPGGGNGGATSPGGAPPDPAVIPRPVASSDAGVIPGAGGLPSEPAVVSDGGTRPPLGLPSDSPFQPPPHDGCTTRIPNLATGTLDVYTCVEAAEGEYGCDCNGVEATSSTTHCASALETACLLEDTGGCDHNWLGACREMGEADSWACLCAHSPSELRFAEGSSCSSTLLDLCGVSCEAEYGSCQPRVSSPPMVGMVNATGGVAYDCVCDAYGERRMSEDGSGCDAALQRGCDTEFGIEGTGPCNGASGYCDYRDDDERWWCACSDGIDVAFDPTTLLGDGADDSCEAVTGVACGPNDGVEECSRDTSAGTAACARAPGSFTTFECVCDSSCTDPTLGEFVAPSCDAALDTACGADGPRCD